MLEDFGPKKHNMSDQARKRYEQTHRKFKERPTWFFRRLEMNDLQMPKMDLDHNVSSSYKANLIFFAQQTDRNGFDFCHFKISTACPLV